MSLDSPLAQHDALGCGRGRTHLLSVKSIDFCSNSAVVDLYVTTDFLKNNWL